MKEYCAQFCAKKTDVEDQVDYFARSRKYKNLKPTNHHIKQKLSKS